MYYSKIGNFDHATFYEVVKRNPEMWRYMIQEQIRFLQYLLDCEANPVKVDEFQKEIEDVDFPIENECYTDYEKR